MTTAELLAAIRRSEAQPWPHYQRATIGHVSSIAGTTRREVEEAVQRARLEGAPILSDGAGISIASTSAEMLEQYRRLRSRYVHQAQTARAVLRTAHAMKATEDAAETPPAVLFPELADVAA